MIFGYPKKQINEFGLLEMKEITFSSSPDELKQIARFLAEMAELMEESDFENCSHRHIQNTIPEWSEDLVDIIVMPAKK